MRRNPRRERDRVGAFVDGPDSLVLSRFFMHKAETIG